MDLLFRGERNLPALCIDRPEALHADRVEGPIVIHPMSKPQLIRTHGLSVPVRSVKRKHTPGVGVASARLVDPSPDRYFFFLGFVLSPAGAYSPARLYWLAIDKSHIENGTIIQRQRVRKTLETSCLDD